VIRRESPDARQARVECVVISVSSLWGCRWDRGLGWTETVLRHASVSAECAERDHEREYPLI